jgi:hypothetical protein
VPFALASVGLGRESVCVRHEPTIQPDGSVQGPAGDVFRRTQRKLTRRECDDLIRDAAPILTDIYPDGLEWWDAADARSRWLEISPLLVNRRSASVREGWVAHLWESERGAAVIRLDGWH